MARRQRRRPSCAPRLAPHLAARVHADTSRRARSSAPPSTPRSRCGSRRSRPTAVRGDRRRRQHRDPRRPARRFQRRRLCRRCRLFRRPAGRARSISSTPLRSPGSALKPFIYGMAFEEPDRPSRHDHHRCAGPLRRLRAGEFRRRLLRRDDAFAPRWSARSTPPRCRSSAQSGRAASWRGCAASGRRSSPRTATTRPGSPSPSAAAA